MPPSHQGQVRGAAHSKNATRGTNGDCWQGGLGRAWGNDPPGPTQKQSDF